MNIIEYLGVLARFIGEYAGQVILCAVVTVIMLALMFGACVCIEMSCE